MATAKLVLGFLILGAAGLVCFKLIPPFFSNYELEDAMKTEAIQSTYTQRTEDEIRETVIKAARNYDIPLTPKQVHVNRSGGLGNGTLTIDAEYSVPIDFPGYSTTFNFHPSSQNKGVF
jgi:hypothetical protein